MNKPNYKGWQFSCSKAIYTHFGEPLYKMFFGLAEEPLKYAIKNKLKLVIKTKYGTAVFEKAKDYLKNAKRIKKFYYFKNKPFYLWVKNLSKDFERYDRLKKGSFFSINDLITFLKENPEKLGKLKEKLNSKTSESS